MLRLYSKYAPNLAHGGISLMTVTIFAVAGSRLPSPIKVRIYCSPDQLRMLAKV